MQLKRETKILEMKAPTVQDNCIKGKASGIGNLDRGNDVIFPGFFKNVLKDFLANGFIAIGHDWAALPIAMPTLAVEQGRDLYSEATFHSTQAAQDARTVCIERKAAGLSVGLSIGFSVANDGYAYFDTGKELLAFAKAQGYDLSLFDAKGINACKSSCRGLLECADLYEWSIVTVPMNPAAAATEAKALAQEAKALAQNRKGKSMPSIVIKGQYLGDIERTTACGVIRSVLSALAGAIYSGLYATDASITAPADLIQDLPQTCDEARDMLVKTLPVLLADVDIEELREQARSYYDYYYASPPGERKAHLNVENEAAPDKAAFSIATVREFEDFLREAGYSRKNATAIALHGFNPSLRDAGEAETTPVPGTDGGNSSPIEPDTATQQARDKKELAYRRLSHKLEGLLLTAPIE